MARVYISCPLDIPQTDLSEVSQTLEASGNVVRYWERGTYYNETDTIKSCEVFVIMLNNNNFKQPITSLTFGIKKELELARLNSKSILLAYKTSNKRYKLYDTDITNVMIGGISNSDENLKIISPFAYLFNTHTESKSMDKIKVELEEIVKSEHFQYTEPTKKSIINNNLLLLL